MRQQSNAYFKSLFRLVLRWDASADSASQTAVS